MPTTLPSTAMIDQVLGHYRVLEKIGSGGMGEVYRASDHRLGREVAVKVLQASFAQDQDRLRRFEQEARSAAALNHPSIVAIYDIGVHKGAPYIVSELLAGQTLRQRLVIGPLSPRQAADFAIQIAQGLVEAHGKHIVHRDIKPENLFITRDERIKILDFGIAKLTNPELGDESLISGMTTQTKAGSVLGTVAYMSPEQLRGKAVDTRSDIFSLGAVLYEMLSGKHAFSGESQVDTITAILKDNPPDIVESRQNIPPAFEQVVRHCLEKEPENRFQSARDLVFALSTLSYVSTSRQNVASVSGSSWLRKRLPITLGVLLLTGLAIWAGTRLMPAHAPDFRRLTFERGTVYSARFSADGRSVVYGASWNGHPLQIYSTIPNSLLARPLGLPSAYLLALSHSDQLALTLHGLPGSRLEFENGTLASAPLVGGTPREILQDVRWADWSPDGNLAVVHHLAGRDNLEYPIGKILYQTNGTISDLRFSPEGDRLAFMDHPERWSDRGTVCVIDLDGHKKTLTSSWAEEYGLAWSAVGNEVWFTAVQSGSTNRALQAVSLSGRQRRIFAVPGGFILQDVSRDGRVLASFDTERLAMEWTGRAESSVKDLSWYDWTVAKDISPDGKWVLFEESSEPTGQNGAAAIRNIDGSPPIHLGEGTVDSLSPDGEWAVSVSHATPGHLTLLPIGPGQSRQIALPTLEHLQTGAHFLPDGKRVVVNGNEVGHAGRTYAIDLAAREAPRPVTPEGMYATLPSPDGRYVAGADTVHKITVFPLDGGPPHPVPGIDPAYVLVQWSADSKKLYVCREGEVPLKVERVDIATGKMQLARELVPADRGGVVSIGPVASNVNASEFAYSYYQTLSVLYEISGLK